MKLVIKVAGVPDENGEVFTRATLTKMAASTALFGSFLARGGGGLTRIWMDGDRLMVEVAIDEELPPPPDPNDDSL
jgi:DNA-binding protein YbaB